MTEGFFTGAMKSVSAWHDRHINIKASKAFIRLCYA